MERDILPLYGPVNSFVIYRPQNKVGHTLLASTILTHGLHSTSTKIVVILPELDQPFSLTGF